MPTSIQDVYLRKLSLYQAGTADSPATYRMYGPLTNPKVSKLEEAFSNSLLISDFQAADGWTGDNVTDLVNFQSQEEAQKLTSTGTQQTMRLTGALDLSDPKYLNFYFYVDTAANLDAQELTYPEPTNLAGAWYFNEGSGAVAYDRTENGNNGVVTGATYVAGTDGYALQFDGASGDVTITDEAAIQNIFDGGGTLSVLVNPASDGEANVGVVAEKGPWKVQTVDEVGGFVRLQLTYAFSGGTGIWQTDRDIPINTVTHFVANYDADSVANDPVFYVDRVSVTVNETGTPV